MAVRPVPPKRRDLMTQSGANAKMDLVNSFAGFSATTVSERQMHLARECIAKLPARSARYELVPYHMMLQWNQEKSNYLSMIAQACDLLLKYVINLLKPKRPQVWRSIKTTNSHFCARVDCMVGARHILTEIGYSEDKFTAMQFPDSVEEPDKPKLHIIAAELLMAKLEVEEQMRNPNQSLSLQGSNPITPSQPSPTQQPRVSHVTMPGSQVTSVTSHGSHMTPVSHAAHEPLNTSVMYDANVPPASNGVPPHSTSADQYQYQHLSSLGSSGDSNCGTASSSPHTSISEESKQDQVTRSTSDSSSESGSVTADMKRALVELQLRKKQIKGGIDKGLSGLSSAATMSTPASTATPLTVRLFFCPMCGIKLHSGHTQCTYCSSPAASHPTSSVPPPPMVSTATGLSRIHSEELQPKLMRASAASAEETMQHHRKTQAFNVSTQGGAGGGASTGLGATPRPSTGIGGGGETGGAVGAPVSTASSPPVKILFCPMCGIKLHSGHTQCTYCSSPAASHPTSSVPPPPMVSTATGLSRMHSEQLQPKPMRASAASAEEAMQHHRKTQAFNVSTQGGAGGGARVETGGAVGGDKTVLDIFSEKERVWKETWRERGYSDEEIPAEPGSTELPPPRVPEQTKKPVGRERRKGKKPDCDPSKSVMVDLDRYRREAEQELVMNQMAQEGQIFMECIKLCVQHGYSLEEVELAYRNTRGPNKQEEVLGYLKGAWMQKIRELQHYVHDMIDTSGRTVGYPSDLEARKHLVQENGDVMRASRKVYQFRKRKIEELLHRFWQFSKLEWGAAVLALSAYDMDVDKACWSIQREALEPMYEFIFSEWTEVAQTDMKNIKEMLKKELEREACVRLLMGEYNKLENAKKANMVLDLMAEFEEDSEYPLSYYIDAAEMFSSLEEAKKDLIDKKKECPICTVSYLKHETIGMPGCTDSLCEDCFKMHFEVVISEKGVKHFNCPICDLPDMTNRDGSQDRYQMLFVHLIHKYLPDQLYDLAQRKLTELTLQKDKGFRWCASEQCNSCFINDDLNRKKVQCLTCKALMCFQCQKPWEDQHDTLSCDAFAEWKRNNDPNFQKEGLAAHLQANGIECPNCNARYELARGGCMHFRCTRCPNEFCSGCGGSFKKGQACGRFESCAKIGLHAHHPRDCLFYMRDFDVKELQDFLGKNRVEFKTEPSEEQIEAAKENEDEEAVGVYNVDADEQEKPAEAKGDDKVVLKCNAMLQKEVPDVGLVDEECGEEVKEEHAGLCVKHYKEYLVDRINKSKVDPLSMYTTPQIILILKREEKEAPEKEPDEEEQQYRERLIEQVMHTLPLERGGPAVAAEPAAEEQPQE